jgi:hypothetical protein
MEFFLKDQALGNYKLLFYNWHDQHVAFFASSGLRINNTIDDHAPYIYLITEERQLHCLGMLIHQLTDLYGPGGNRSLSHNQILSNYGNGLLRIRNIARLDKFAKFSR